MVWTLILQPESEGPALISCAAGCFESVVLMHRHLLSAPSWRTVISAVSVLGIGACGGGGGLADDEEREPTADPVAGDGPRLPRVMTSVSRVWFREIGLDERRWYCASGEPLDKAGAYAIQGRAAIFVSRLDGSYSGVMGLPLFETASLLREAGIDVRTPPVTADRRTRSEP